MGDQIFQLKMTWSVILIVFKSGDKLFQRGPKISSKIGLGVHFLGGPNISPQTHLQKGFP